MTEKMVKRNYKQVSDALNHTVFAYRDEATNFLFTWTGKADDSCVKLWRPGYTEPLHVEIPTEDIHSRSQDAEHWVTWFAGFCSAYLVEQFITDIDEETS
jgi:hypothetical protein